MSLFSARDSEFSQACLSFMAVQACQLWDEAELEPKEDQNAFVVSSSTSAHLRLARLNFLVCFLRTCKALLASNQVSQELRETVSHNLILLFSFWGTLSSRRRSCGLLLTCGIACPADERCESFDTIISMLSTQDDMLISSIGSLLDIWVLARSLSARRGDLASLSRLCNQVANPHVVFMSFIRTIGFDVNVLIDFLLDEHLEFVSYLTTYGGKENLKPITDI